MSQNIFCYVTFNWLERTQRSLGWRHTSPSSVKKSSCGSRHISIHLYWHTLRGAFFHQSDQVSGSSSSSVLYRMSWHAWLNISTIQYLHIPVRLQHSLCAQQWAGITQPRTDTDLCVRDTSVDTLLCQTTSFKRERCVWWSPARSFSLVQHDAVHTPWRSWLRALLYSPEVCGFAPRFCHWNFSLTWSFLLHCGPGVDSTSKRNAYQEYFLGCKGGLCAGLTLLPSCAGCVKIWKPQPRGSLRASPGL
jgi:hypothetical protein